MKKALLAVLLLAAVPAIGAARTKEFLSPVFTIDRIYRSMEGPYAEQPITVGGDGRAELVWIRSMKVEVVGEDGRTPLPREFMCHVNLDLDTPRHASRFGSSSALNPRVMTLTQGQMSVSFPPTFAYPVSSDEVLTLTTQVVNLKRKRIDVRARLKVTLELLDDPERVLPLRPLTNTAVFASRRVPENAAIAPLMPAPGGGEAPPQHASCNVPRPSAETVRAPNAMATSDYLDTTGAVVTGHWIVPPGRQVTESDVTDLLRLPFATTLHHAAVHVHPWCESLELRDVTTNTTIFKAYAKRRADGAGLQHIDAFSSGDGVALFPTHTYKLIATYDNRSAGNVDAMAAMFLGLFNPTFDRTRSVLDGPAVVVRTTVGELRVSLLPDAAPATVAQFLRLVRHGAYDGTPFVRLEPGFVAQTAVARRGGYTARVPLETDHDVKHVRGVLSMAHADGDPDGGESSFSILLGAAPHLDGKYTIFGRIDATAATLAALDQLAGAGTLGPRVAITSIAVEGEESAIVTASAPLLETPTRAPNVRRN